MVRGKDMVFSPKLSVTVVITSVLFFFIYQSKGISDSSVEISEFAYEKVNLSVYYESLCLPCATFIVKDLGDLFNNDLINIVNLKLVPWANSYVNVTNNSISCQNGPKECMLNSLEACALSKWPIVSINYALIYCFEFLAIEGRSEKWEDCFDQLDLPSETVLNCSRGGNGTELAKKYINETAQLYPAPSLLPWVVVNNQPIGEDYTNFTYYVCKAYRGVAAPATCASYLRN